MCLFYGTLFAPIFLYFFVLLRTNLQYIWCQFYYHNKKNSVSNIMHQSTISNANLTLLIWHTKSESDLILYIIEVKKLMRNVRIVAFWQTDKL